MCSAYVWPRLVQGQGKTLTFLPMLQMGYSSPSVIALIYEFTLFYKIFWFHPVTYGGRHDCFRFRKHPSSSIIFCAFENLLYVILTKVYYIVGYGLPNQQRVGRRLSHGDCKVFAYCAQNQIWTKTGLSWKEVSSKFVLFCIQLQYKENILCNVGETQFSLKW